MGLVEKSVCYCNQ